MSKIFITGHKNPDTDSICSALSYAALKQAQGVEAVAVRLGEVGKEAQYALDYFQVEAPELIASVEEKQAVMLVDHNEPAQSVDGLDKAELLEIVDHHRLGGLNTANPIFVHIEPVGCTATIITKMFDCQKVELPKKIAGLLLSAIVSDTVLFKSPTCTEQDKAAAEKLAVELDKVTISDAKIPVVANVSAEILTKAEDIKASLVAQAASPVLWEDCVARMKEFGADVLLEAGPGKTLCGFNRRIDKTITSLNVEDVASLEKSLDYFKEVR